jgi:G3E family GTPase
VKIPVSLITGYLGSGKTTLIARLLALPQLDQTAVIVNELGEVGIDHHLLRRVDERTVLLNSGCVCCTLRGDLVSELHDLLDRSSTGDIPPFRRVIVETTGLADPTPIVNTLLADPMVRHQYILDAVVATVDAVHGLQSPESVKQAAVADTLVITKTDLVDAENVEEQLARLNPLAEIVEAVYGDIQPEQLFGRRLHDPRELPVEGHDHPHDEIRPVYLFLDQELDWTAFGVWLTMLLQARGRDLYRVKGFLNVGGSGPLLLNGVQHVVYPPEHLDAWPDTDRRSRLVFIGRQVEREPLERSLAVFNRMARATLDSPA